MTASRALLRISLLCVVYLTAAWITGTGLVDDTYIFLRYARNIIEGHGPVFNPGERVEGYTSPLWLACVTVLAILKRDPSTLAGYLSGAMGFLTIVVVSRRSLAGALAIASHPGFVFWAFSGMETAIAGLLMTLAFVGLLDSPPSRRSCLGSGLAYAGACLARPDSIVLAPVGLAWLLYQSRALPERKWENLAAFASPMVLVGIHSLWRYSYYGVWLPNTAYAKVGVGAPFLIEQGVRYLPGMLMSWGTVLALLLVSSRRQIVLGLALAASWSVYIVFVGGDFFPYARFGMVLLPLLAAIADCKRIRISHWWAAPAVIAAGALLLTAANRELAAREIQLATGWRETGIWLNKHLPADSTIASLVAGGIPYYSQRRTIDLLGLTDAHIGRSGQIATGALVGHQRFDSAYVLSRRPDVIVMQESGRSRSPRFRPGEWPHFTAAGELQYVRAMEDLVQQEETRRLYTYRPERLPNGTYVEALWLKNER